MSALTLSYLQSLPPQQRQQAIFQEFVKCKSDPIYCIEIYFTIVDSQLGKRIPFILYPYQHRTIKAYEEFSHNLTMKTRQMGFTTVTAAYISWVMCTKQNQVINALSYEKKLSRRFLRLVREMLDDVRRRAPWLVPDYVLGNNGKDSFTLKTNCMITAESNKPDACRGEVINFLVIDESTSLETKVLIRNKKTGERKTVNIGKIYKDSIFK